MNLAVDKHTDVEVGSKVVGAGTETRQGANNVVLQENERQKSPNSRSKGNGRSDPATCPLFLSLADLDLLIN